MLEWLEEQPEYMQSFFRVKGQMMETTILFFGQLTDITGKSSIVFDTTGIQDTDQLKEKLYETYPALRNSKYIIAIDKELIAQAGKIKPGATIAFLPPFSGG